MQKQYLIRMGNELELQVQPDVEHEYVLTTEQVAEGYGITSQAVRMQKQRNADELAEGKHWVVTICDTPGGQQEMTMWTKRGIIRLGFFIRSERAKMFRDAA
jgi:hypothetical protein